LVRWPGTEGTGERRSARERYPHAPSHVVELVFTAKTDGEEAIATAQVLASLAGGVPFFGFLLLIASTGGKG
jgi:hypothetical protein